MKKRLCGIIMVFLITSKIVSDDAVQQILRDYNNSYAIFQVAFQNQLPFTTGKLLKQRLLELERLEKTLGKDLIISVKDSSDQNYYKELYQKLVDEKRVLQSLALL